MGLYLCVFSNDEELDGVEVGSYADFGEFRSAVATHIEGGVEGSRCPTLMLHSDSDGEWTPEEATALESELGMIAQEFANLPPTPIDGWKAEVATMFGIKPANLGDCFFDVDGEPLLERLLGLVQLSQQRGLPILFQ